MTRAAPGQRGDYPLFEPVEMRWADMDIYGHMNNAVHYQLFDTAIGRFALREGLVGVGASPTIFLVVSSGCEYFAEIRFQDRLEAGLRVARLGRSSVTYQISLFPNGDDLAAATGHFTHVNVDRETKRPVAFTDAARAVLARLAGAKG